MMNNNAIKFGVIGGVSLIVYTVFLWLSNSFGSFILGLLSMVIALVFLILSAKAAKKEHEGQLDFKTAFVAVFTTGVVMTIISTLFSILLFNVISPDLSEVVKEAAIESTVEFMEKFDMPDSEIDTAVADIEEDMNGSFTVVGQIKSLLFSLIFYVFLSLIIAMIVKTPAGQLNAPKQEILD